jgi:uncharacterized membrane protein YphA (DoxX/SURF4 family)
MTGIGIVASILVGSAFVLAGASKLAVGQAWPAQARELGAPSWSPLVVPWFELVVGATLIAGLVRPVPALLAIGALVVFTALIVARLREGRRPSCACFGAWSAKPIGASHVVRNAVLLALAVIACWA